MIKPGQKTLTEMIQNQGTMTGSEDSKAVEGENALGADTKKEVEILKREAESLTKGIKLLEEQNFVGIERIKGLQDESTREGWFNGGVLKITF